MESYSDYSSGTLSDLSDRFTSLKFYFANMHIGINISVFFVIGSSAELGENENWRIISDEIALKFQSKIAQKHDKWNLYIIYLSTNKVDIGLKAKIEYDKFSSRKIVVDEYTEKLSDKAANNLIIEHITHTDLIEVVNNTEEKKQENYEPKHSNIWDLIPNDRSVLGKKDLQDHIIEELKKVVNYEN